MSRSNDMADLTRPLGSRPVRLHTPGWLENLVSGCQVLAGMELVAQPLQLLLEIERLIVELPDSSVLHEQLLARSLLIRVFGRLARQAGLENDVRFANVLIQLAASDSLTRSAFRIELVRSIGLCRRAIEGNKVTVKQHAADARVAHALLSIKIQYRNPALALADIAKDVGLSPWHLTRLLTRHSGMGFSSHLHQTRVVAAQRLLANSTIPIKQVAAAVGYQSTVQLDRHFKRLSGLTPIRFREQQIAFRVESR